MAAGGGAWKVAYADFVTAMMAFFMVMWLTSQKPGIKEAVAGYFREPFATYKSHQKGAAGTAKPVLDPMYGHTAQPQKRRLAISGDVTDYQFTLLFPEGSADLEPEQLQSIHEFAPMMAGKLNRVEVRAHTIRSPLPPDGQFKDHWDLCFARCQEVREQLQSLGVEPERIRLSQAEGNEPLAANLTPEELKLNSRVDVILLPDLADIPWECRQAEEDQAEAVKESTVTEGVAHAESHAIDEAVTDVHQPPSAPEAHASAHEHEASPPASTQDEPQATDHSDSHAEPAAHPAPDAHAEPATDATPDPQHPTDNHAAADAHAPTDSHAAAPLPAESPAAAHAEGHGDHGAEHPPAELHVPPPH
jgi:chemotaxis protein MotB